MRTMLDTPLVRGEREGFAEAGGARLDMAQGRKQEARRECEWRTSLVLLFKALTWVHSSHSVGVAARPLTRLITPKSRQGTKGSVRSYYGIDHNR
jgi:hypothetical protein